MKQVLLLAGAAALAFASPALAKGKGHGNHGKGKHSLVHSQHGKGSLYGVGRNGCPPGHAKNRLCMPPGQYKKHYSVGQRLPFGYNGFTPYDRIPYDLRRTYGLNDDYRYIYRDQYLYRVDPRTMVVQQILNAIL